MTKLRTDPDEVLLMQNICWYGDLGVRWFMCTDEGRLSTIVKRSGFFGNYQSVLILEDLRNVFTVDWRMDGLIGL